MRTDGVVVLAVGADVDESDNDAVVAEGRILFESEYTIEWLVKSRDLETVCDGSNEKFVKEEIMCITERSIDALLKLARSSTDWWTQSD